MRDFLFYFFSICFIAIGFSFGYGVRGKIDNSISKGDCVVVTAQVNRIVLYMEGKVNAIFDDHYVICIDRDQCESFDKDRLRRFVRKIQCN